MTLALINLSPNESVSIDISGLSAKRSDQPRQEYHLSGSPTGGGHAGLSSRALYMNGAPVTPASFEAPNLVAVNLPVNLQPSSIAFVDIPDASAAACLRLPPPSDRWQDQTRRLKTTDTAEEWAAFLSRSDVSAACLFRFTRRLWRK